MNRRRALNVTLLALLPALGACPPPIVENADPVIEVPSGTDGVIKANEGSGSTLAVEVHDADDGSLLHLTAASDLDGATFFDAPDLAPDAEVQIPWDDLTNVGQHVVTLTLTDGTATDTQVLNVLYNGRPSLPTIVLNEEHPITTDDLEATLGTGSVDPEGLAILYSWEWRDLGTGERVGGPQLSDDHTEKGEVWEITLTAAESTNGTSVDEDGNSVQATLDVTIENAPPTGAPTLAISPGSPWPIDDLRCDVVTDATDPDGDTLDHTWQWFADGVEAVGFEDQLLPSTAIAPGERWSCKAAATDGEASGAVGTSAQVLVATKVVAASSAVVRLAGSSSGDHGFGSPFVGATGDATSGPDLLVGAPDYRRATDTIGATGRVHMFRGGALVAGERDSSTRSATLLGAQGDHIGAPLVLTPDIFGDGEDDIVVGMLPDATRPVVWVVPSGTLTSGGAMPAAAVAVQPSSDASVDFGFGVVGGDWDGGQGGDLIVGEDSSTSTGTVWLFTGTAIAGAGPNGTCTVAGTQPCITTIDADGRIDGPSANDGFGNVLALGDIDGDGANELLVTATRHSGSGYAWVFPDDQLGGDINVSLAATQFNTIADDAAGAAALLQDLDDDGYADVILSAPDADGSAGTDIGKVQIFFSPGNGNMLPASITTGDITIEGTELGGDFGRVLASPGDLGSDGVPEVVISAPGEDAGAGTVYVFTGVHLGTQPAGTIFATDADLEVHGESAGDGLIGGYWAGDLDSNGWNDLLVASPGAGSGDEGKVYVLRFEL